MITVPLGFLPQNTPVYTNETIAALNLPVWPSPNFPFGISFIGTVYSEARLIELAYSYEQATLTHNKRANRSKLLFQKHNYLTSSTHRNLVNQ